MSSYQEQAHPGPTSAGAPADNGEPPALAEPGPARPALSLFDAVNIIVGIVVGASIYQVAPDILAMSGSPQVALVMWGLAGLLSLVGALCYAELATTYPRDGGDIVYLTRAFGGWAGFLFGWVQLTVILTGSIGMMAFVFANYATRLVDVALGWELGALGAFGLAGGAVLVLTLANVLGVLYGKVVQNVLTVAKVFGLVAIIAAGFLTPTEGAWEQHNEPFTAFPPMIGVVLVLILYAYGGWNDAAFVAAEVKDGKKNITRALVLGVLIITALYLLVNAAYIHSLGFHKAKESKQIAADVLDRGFGAGGVALMSALVMVSALGAVNGLIFTGARVYSTIGKDYPGFGWMGGWSRAQGAPVPALITQGVLVMGLIFLVGTRAGREGINHVLNLTATATETKQERGADGQARDMTVPSGHVLTPINWPEEKREDGSPAGAGSLAKGGFDILLGSTAPIFWGFFLLTGVSLFVLRQRDPHLVRPFKVPLYPELPLIFCVSCGYMVFSSLDYVIFRKWKGGLFLLGVLPLLIGLVLYRLSRTGGGAAPGRPDSTA